MKTEPVAVTSLYPTLAEAKAKAAIFFENEPCASEIEYIISERIDDSVGQLANIIIDRIGHARYGSLTY